MSHFFAAVKQQRVSLACAVTVAAVLIVIGHAPVAPVVAGCLLSLVYLVGRSWMKLSSGRVDR